MMRVSELERADLGLQDENGARELRIDCTGWAEDLAGKQLLIAARRPGEKSVYLPTVRTEGNTLIWVFSDADTAIEGWGMAEVRAVAGDKMRKHTFATHIAPSLAAAGSEPPAPIPDWVRELVAAAQRAEAAADTANAAAARTDAAIDTATEATNAANVATSAAQDAAQEATGAAGNANAAAQTANTAASAANTAKTNADAATKSANDAAKSIDGMTVSGRDTVPGGAVTVTKSMVDGHIHLSFTIPRGHDGPQGDQGVQGVPGPQGIQGPKGDKGDRGDSGVTVPINGLFILVGDEEGNLWAYYGDAQTPPEFEVDAQHNIYYIVPEV